MCLNEKFKMVCCLQALSQSEATSCIEVTFQTIVSNKLQKTIKS